MQGNNFRAFRLKDGIYFFNSNKFREMYNGIRYKRHGEKSKLKKEISKELNCEIPTIEGWIKGNSGPSGIDLVNKLEAFFNVPSGSFLTPQTKSMQKNTLEGKTMHEIKDHERDIARKLYTEMCDMIDGLEYYSNEFIQATAGRMGNTPQGFKYLGTEAFPFLYRDHLIQNVRKAGFDLPKQLRDQLMTFILEAFGDGCYDTGMMYFESQGYKDYLERTNLADNDDTKERYSVMYIDRLYEKLDSIFADYLCE